MTFMHASATTYTAKISEISGKEDGADITEIPCQNSVISAPSDFSEISKITFYSVH